MKRNPHKLMVAGGGTGGHFFCGLAFAQKYLGKYPQAEVVFVGVRRGIEGKFKLDDKRMKIEFIQALQFQGSNPLQKALAMLSLGFGVLGGVIRLFRHRPRVLLGVGGYSSASTMLAAVLVRPFIKMKAVVIDQNSVPGFVNRFLSRFLPAYGPFPYAGFKTIELPLREEAEKAAETAPEPQWPPKKILIMGGSQGALGLNKAWIRLMSDLARQDQSYQIFHQAGSSSFQNVQAAYNEFRLPAEVFAFSNDIYRYLSEADLVVARAGALTVMECVAFRRPTLFVPFPFAADNHQFKNAQAVQHPSWIVPETRLDWKSVESVLKAREPRVPSLRLKPIASWRSLFKA